MIVFVIRGLHTIELYDIRMNVFQIIWHLINNIYISKAINLKKYMSLMFLRPHGKVIIYLVLAVLHYPSNGKIYWNISKK